MSVGLLLALLLQASIVANEADPPEPPVEPIANLRGVVVDAIRDCLPKTNGEIRVCSPDRGFSEGEGNRVRKLKPPAKPVSGNAITVTVTGTSNPPPPK